MISLDYSKSTHIQIKFHTGFKIRDEPTEPPCTSIPRLKKIALTIKKGCCNFIFCWCI